MATLDDHIAQSLRESQRSGELQSAPSWGKPLNLNDGFAQTPDELRMAFKALKDAGFVPPEVETMQQIAVLREQVASNPNAPEAESHDPGKLLKKYDILMKEIEETEAQLQLELSAAIGQMDGEDTE